MIFHFNVQDTSTKGRVRLMHLQEDGRFVGGEKPTSFPFSRSKTFNFKIASREEANVLFVSSERLADEKHRYL